MRNWVARLGLVLKWLCTVTVTKLVIGLIITPRTCTLNTEEQKQSCRRNIICVRLPKWDATKEAVDCEMFWTEWKKTPNKRTWLSSLAKFLFTHNSITKWTLFLSSWTSRSATMFGWWSLEERRQRKDISGGGGGRLTAASRGKRSACSRRPQVA